MGRAGRGGGMRGGGLGRSGGGLRSGGAGRSLGSNTGRAGRGSGFTTPRVTPPRVPNPRPAPVPRRGLSGAAGFGLGLGTGLAMGGRRRRMWGFGPRWGFGRRRMMGSAGVGHGGGCGSFLMVIVVLVLLVSVISMFNNWNPVGGVTETQVTTITPTRVREPLVGVANNVGPWYTDNLGWIQNRTQMETGLREFFTRTGVRPHVYITGSIDGNTAPTSADMESFASARYGELFRDEGHLLLVFFEYGDAVEVLAYPGAQAGLLMDQEAIDILLDYIAFYYVADVSEELFFSNAFGGAAQRIMHRPPDNRAIWLTLIVVSGVVLVSIIAFNFWKKRQIQKNLEAEQTERILSQDLGTFGDDEASELAKQYEEN